MNRKNISSLQEDESLFHRALSMDQSGNKIGAAEIYRSLLEKFPEHAGLFSLLGTAELQLGNPSQGLSLFEKSLQIQPNDPGVHNNRGLALIGLRRLDEALESFDRAIQLKPDYAVTHYNRGSVLKDLRRLDESLESYDRAIQLKPDYADAYGQRGNVLTDLHRLDDALESFDRAIQLKLDFAVTYYNRGNVLKSLQRLDEALESYDHAIRLKPDYVEAHNNRGNVLKDLQRLDDALESYDRAIRLRPNYAEALANLGGTLYDLGRLDEAVAACQKSISLNSGYAQSHSNLGAALNDLGRLDEAEASCRQAIDIDPNYTKAYSNLGNVLTEMGSRLLEAEASYRKALSLNPDFAECHLNLSQQKKYKKGDPDIPAIRRIYDAARNESERMYASFALAKACEDLGEYDEAFGLYAEGNALRNEGAGYRIEQDRKLFGRIKSAFDELPGIEPVPLGSTTPIFIVGMPRSGTSLVEQILASHSAVFGAGELATLNALAKKHFLSMNTSDFTLVRASVQVVSGYLDELGSKSAGHRFITDKMPLNFRWLGFLLLAQPDIKVIHMVRDPVAVCWSIYKLYFPMKGLGFANDLADLAEYYKMYQDLMRFWHERFPGRIYDLNYERLTENQEEETRKLLNYCGLPWEDRCLEFEKTERAVRTASAAQVRAKMYQGSSEAWRNFEGHLAPLLEGLGMPVNLSYEHFPKNP